jgi:hypothetical protein
MLDPFRHFIRGETQASIFGQWANIFSAHDSLPSV